MKNHAMNAYEWSLLILLSIVWGSSFFFIEIILRELQPFTLVLGRTAIASVVLVIIVYARGLKLPTSPQVWGTFLIMGVLNNMIPFSLIVWGQQHIDSGLASILNATSPIFAVILAHFLTSDEKLTLNRAFGVLIGVIGVTVLIGPTTIAGLGDKGLAQLAVLGASCSYAVAGIYSRRFKGMPSIVPPTGMLICTTILMIPITWWVDRPRQLQLVWTTWGALLGLAILGTAFAYLLYFRILKTAGATNALLVTFLIPISAILLGVFVLREQMKWVMVSGMILIFAGLGLVDGRIVRKFFTSSVQRTDSQEGVSMK